MPSSFHSLELFFPFVFHFLLKELKPHSYSKVIKNSSNDAIQNFRVSVPHNQLLKTFDAMVNKGSKVDLCTFKKWGKDNVIDYKVESSLFKKT